MGERGETDAAPKPGSDAAVARGCTCPVMDNARGKGVYGVPGQWWITAGCPVHSPTPPEED